VIASSSTYGSEELGFGQSVLIDSYRPAIFALIAFFLLGGALLLKVDTARGIREAGNTPPSVV
jgi:hypothetical protein